MGLYFLKCIKLFKREFNFRMFLNLATDITGITVITVFTVYEQARIRIFKKVKMSINFVQVFEFEEKLSKKKVL